MHSDLRSSDPVIVSGGMVLNPENEAARPPVADIRIEDGRIQALGPQGSVGSADSARVIDARGMLVTPGFINAHYHSHDVLFRGMFEQVPLEAWVLGSSPANYPRRSVDEVRLRTLLGAAENLRCGITTIQDMVTIVGPDREHVETVLSAYAEVGIRTLLALQMSDRPVADTVPFWRNALSGSALAQLGQGGSPGRMQDLILALLSARRLPSSDLLRWGLAPSAPQRCSEELLTWVARVAKQCDLRIFTHLYETRSQAVLARIDYARDTHSLVSFMGRLGLLTDRLSIAHGVWITDAEIGELSRAGVSLLFNPMSNLKLMNGIAPIRRYADAGVNIGLGCDNCSGNDAQNIFEAMKSFALWWGFQSDVGESGAARMAFRAATLGGAKSLGLEHEIGRIRPGFRADLVLMSLDDPCFVPLNDTVRQLVYAATPRVVKMVVVGGTPLFIQDRVLTIDEQAAAQAARQMHGSISKECHEVQSRNASLRDECLAIHRKISRYQLEIDRLRLTVED